MTSYRISDAARLLGVSDDTVRRWIDQGALPTTDAAPAEIPGEALAAKAVELAHTPNDPTDRLSSARNRFTGLVTRVQLDGVMAQVDIQCGNAFTGVAQRNTGVKGGGRFAHPALFVRKNNDMPPTLGYRIFDPGGHFGILPQARHFKGRCGRH
jgi:hypothetical protein